MEQNDQNKGYVIVNYKYCNINFVFSKYGQT